MALSWGRREEGEGYREERRGLAAKLQLNLKERRGEERREEEVFGGLLVFPLPYSQELNKRGAFLLFLDCPVV